MCGSTSRGGSSQSSLPHCPSPSHGRHAARVPGSDRPCFMERLPFPGVQATGFVDEATGKNRTVPFEIMVQGDKCASSPSLVCMTAHQNFFLSCCSLLSCLL